MENSKTIEKTNKIKSSFFEKIKKIDKYLSTPTKEIRQRTEITKLEMEEGTLTLLK